MRCVLLCARREPLSKLPGELLCCVLSELAAMQFWRAVSVDLDEGEDARQAPHKPLHARERHGDPAHKPAATYSVRRLASGGWSKPSSNS